MVSFVMETKGLGEGFVYVFPLLLSLRYAGKWGHSWRDRGVGSDRMTEVVLLFLYRLICG